jgi:hypothetical protein
LRETNCKNHSDYPFCFTLDDDDIRNGKGEVTKDKSSLEPARKEN